MIDEAHVYVAPKLIGGDKALSPVGGLGIAEMSEAMGFGDAKVEALDGDVWISVKRA